MNARNPSPTRYESEQARGHLPLFRARSSAAVVAAAVLMLGGPAIGLAAVFNCPGGDVLCLISAINMANGTVAADTINLAAGTYTLNAVDNNTDGPNGLPSISSDITIQGAGATTTVVQRDPLIGANPPAFRILHVAASGTLKLRDLTVTGGFLDDFDGPGIFSAGGVVKITDSIVSDNTGFQMSLGAGVFNDTGGTLTIKRSSVVDNVSNGDGGSAGIFNRGTAEIIKSAIDHNLSFTGSTGGIRNSGVMYVTNTTVSRNFMDDAIAAGILNEDGGTMTISNGTIAENDATFAFGGTGGLVNLSGTVELRNTILVANTSFAGFVTDFSNCSGAIMSLGNNVIGASKVADACVINDVASDIKGIDAGVLGAFMDDGTPGNGHFPLPSSSPAIDAGNPADPGSGGNACKATDQLGSPRPVDGDCDGTAVCDSGAIEFAPPVEDVNAELSGTPDPSSFAFDPTPVPGGPAGTFSFTAEFCNIGVKNLTCLKSVTTTLTGGNALLNRNSSTPFGVGSELSFPLMQGFADGVLSAGECVDVFYQIGLTAMTSFDFLVDVVGVAP